MKIGRLSVRRRLKNGVKQIGLGVLMLVLLIEIGFWLFVLFSFLKILIEKIEGYTTVKVIIAIFKVCLGIIALCVIFPILFEVVLGIIVVCFWVAVFIGDINFNFSEIGDLSKDSEYNYQKNGKFT